MSFANNVKQEIITKNIFKNDTKSLLQGLILGAGSLIIKNKELSFMISLENEMVAKFIKQKLMNFYLLENCEIVGIFENFKSKMKFQIELNKVDSDKILSDLGIIKFENNELVVCDVCDKGYLKNDKSALAFLTGLFLTAGSISVPQDETSKKTYGYHFEIDVSSKNQADIVAEILSNVDIFAKVVERSDEFVVYVKNSETICDILSLMGANKTVLDLENNKVSRDLSNSTNRQINCMTANIDKAVNAASLQIKAIEVIRQTIGIENLPDNLCETALLRLSNPEASLSELISLMENPISKGALAQRFAKIIKISNDLGENNG